MEFYSFYGPPLRSLDNWGSTVVLTMESNTAIFKANEGGLMDAQMVIFGRHLDTKPIGWVYIYLSLFNI